MKGLVLAGGAGLRLRPFLGAKQLVPVGNRPILFYVMSQLAEAGLQHVAVVISPETGAEVRAALGDGARWGTRIEYVVQERPAGLAHAVRCARDFLGDDPFCLFLGDSLIGGSIRDAADRFRRAPELAGSVLVKEVESPRSFGVAEVDAAGNLVRVVEKPAQPRSNLALVGVYFFRTAIFAAIDAIQPSARGELEITDAIGALIEQGGQVRSERLDAWWLDTGTKDDLLRANAAVLGSWLEPAVLGSVDAASTLVGLVRVEAGAVVERSTIRGPAVIGAGARVIDSDVGPCTSVGAGARVERSHVVRSIVLERCRIEGVARLEDSLVGRRARLRSHPARTAALSLVVADDASLELA